MIALLMIAAVPEDTQAQGLYTPNSSGYVLGDTTRMVHILGPFNGTVTTAKVGVYFTKGASEDSLTKVQIFHSINSTAINAGYGEQLSTDTSLRFTNSAASEYQEETITVTGGIHYLGIKIVPVGTATDTTNVLPQVYLK